MDCSHISNLGPRRVVKFTIPDIHTDLVKMDSIGSNKNTTKLISRTKIIDLLSSVQNMRTFSPQIILSFGFKCYFYFFTNQEIFLIYFQLPKKPYDPILLYSLLLWKLIFGFSSTDYSVSFPRCFVPRLLVLVSLNEPTVLLVDRGKG